MKKRANLFSQRIESQTANKYFQYGKRITYSVLLLGVVFFVVLISAYYYFNQQLIALNGKKNIYSRYILANKSLSQDIQHFVYKFSLLKTYLESDVSGFTHYKYIISMLQPIENSYDIESYTINNNRTVTFSLIVPTYNEGLQVLAFFEKEDVLKNFDSLILESFDITETSSNYTMTFNGVLKPIN